MPPLAPMYSAAQVRAAEAPLLAAGVPLMRRAAQALAAVIDGVIAEQSTHRMLVLAGAGDNGGDALFAAAEIAAGGTRVDLVRTSGRVHDEAIAVAVDAGASVVPVAELDPAAYDLVVDGILGIGARGSLRGAARDIVERLRPARPRTVAVDLPSGLDPDTGEADEVVLPAAVTVTFGAVKHGLAVGAGPDLTGRIVLVDLGLALEHPLGEATIAEIRQG